MLKTKQHEQNKAYITVQPQPSWVSRELVTTNVHTLQHQLNNAEPSFIEDHILVGINDYMSEAYPSVGTGPGDPEDSSVGGGAGGSRKSRPPWHDCPGCKNNVASTRREHNRVPGVCRYPHVTPEPEWTCPGCARVPPRPRLHADHTYEQGKCRWFDKGVRAPHTRNRDVHPREPRIRASADPTAGEAGSTVSPSTNTPPPIAPPVQEGGSSSSASGAVPPPAEPADVLRAPRQPRVTPGSVDRAGRGPDHGAT